MSTFCLIITNYRQNDRHLISLKKKKNPKDKRIGLLKICLLSHTTGQWPETCFRINSLLETLITYMCFPLFNTWQTDPIAHIYSSSVVHVLRVLHDLRVQLYLWLKQRTMKVLCRMNKLTFYVLRGI